ncbi:MAG: hypothetical protein AB1898_17655 [Acidobacteriota bacterium]
MGITTETVVETAPSQPRSRFELVFVVTVVLLNLFALGLAWYEQGWGAIAIAFVGSPLLNGVFVLVSLIALPVLRRRHRPFSVRRHLALSFGLPIAAIVIDALLIFSMG